MPENASLLLKIFVGLSLLIFVGYMIKGLVDQWVHKILYKENENKIDLDSMIQQKIQLLKDAKQHLPKENLGHSDSAPSSNELLKEWAKAPQFLAEKEKVKEFFKEIEWGEGPSLRLMQAQLRNFVGNKIDTSNLIRSTHFLWKEPQFYSYILKHPVSLENILSWVKLKCFLECVTDPHFHQGEIAPQLKFTDTYGPQAQNLGLMWWLSSPEQFELSLIKEFVMFPKNWHWPSKKIKTGLNFLITCWNPKIDAFKEFLYQWEKRTALIEIFLPLPPMPNEQKEKQDWAKKILGIGPESSLELIKKQFKKKALERHPDMLPIKDPELLQVANLNFGLINEAYQLLEQAFTNN